MEGALGIVAGLVLALLLLAGNALFVAAEFAIVAVRRTRIETMEAAGYAAQVVQRALRDPNTFVAATQLGITVTSIGLGWLAKPAVVPLMEAVLAPLPVWVIGPARSTVAAGLAFFLVTALHITLGELAPKSVALWRPEGTAFVVAPPTVWFQRLFYPLIWLLNNSTNRLLALLGLRAPAGHHVAFSEAEIRVLVTESREAGVLEPEEERLVHRVFRFTERTAGEVLVPRVEMVAVPREATLQEVAVVVKEQGYTRIPVYSETLDQVVGMVHVKDLLVALQEDRGDQRAETLMRPVLHVPESKPVVDLLGEMRDRRIALAVVVEEFGGTAGIVTIEDLVEEIVGEIPGEFRREEGFIRLKRSNLIVVDAAIPLADLNDAFEIDLPTEEANTLGGFIFHHLGRVPERGFRFRTDRLELTIEAMTGPRIDLVRIRKLI